ncbi:hypothetical protein C7974DRAFT_387320 [Boeremia exigua]|uniref:uncharacterized protein n=1 Tax=Boeremia exigua TaxID=749465 RepID=UPI001E8DE2B2|nr:uncharacterized protein C7974DRAFT_387320 [Boeremia exigua]KAH6638798.1 hypothetical protein C7974DRAFT_387320 [Boeremia exigua]
MAHYEFSLQLDVPKRYPKRTTKLVRYNCHDSDGLNHCDCIADRGNLGPESCCFYGRPIEPLAFCLPPYWQIKQQTSCPLYSVLPEEIRLLIFQFALTDDDALKLDDNMFRRESGTDADVARSDVACALLQTCKAVYLEAYRLPMQLNGYQSYRIYGRPRPNLGRIAPWQYALIQRLDSSLQQVSLEGVDLEYALADWKPAIRHAGAYVAPRFYNDRRRDYRPENVTQAHVFGLVECSKDTNPCMQDGDRVTLSQGWNEPSGTYPDDYPRTFTARAMIARSITHLTIRLSRTDWWTWTEDPSTTDQDKQLALDPACGGADRPSVADMLALAASRRSGQHPAYTSTWGSVIGTLPGLKTLELVLETFAVKKHQLDVVVECAQTWKFPLHGTRCELAHDGRVEAMRWAERVDGEETCARDSEPGNKAIDVEDERIEGRITQEEALLSSQEASHDHQESADVTSQDWGADESLEPSWSLDGDDQSDYSASSPVFNPVGYADDWDAFPEEPWIRTAREFEVRVVRFRRRRAN